MPCARGARRIMKLFRYIKKLSHRKLRVFSVLIALCTGSSLFFGAAASASAAVVTYTAPNTYQWTAPGGVTSVTVTVIGGGGGGSGGAWSEGNCAGDAGLGGAGGAGGYTVNQVVPVTPGQAYSVTVGGGGAGGARACGGNYQNGAPGGSSSFGSVVATGGGAGVWYAGGVGGTPGFVDGGGGNPWLGSSGKARNLMDGTAGTWYCSYGTTAGTNNTGYGSGGLSYCAGWGQAGTAGYVSVSYEDPCPTAIETPWQSNGLLLSPGTTRKVTQLGNNFCLTNNSGSTYFVPANTSNELQSFINAINSLNIIRF